MTLVIISMAQHDYLSLEGGEEILEWVCLNCATPQSVVLEWEQKQASKQKVRNFPPPPPSFIYLFMFLFLSLWQEKKDAGGEKISPAQVRQACEDLLMLAASTIPHMGPVLWPFLLEMVVPKQLSLFCRVVVCLFVSFFFLFFSFFVFSLTKALGILGLCLSLPVAWDTWQALCETLEILRTILSGTVWSTCLVLKL